MELEFIVDPQHVKPYLAQIRDGLRTRIRHRELVPGDRLPSFRELSQQWGVSMGVVRQALNTLSEEGYVRIHHGRGVFVANPLHEKQNLALVLPSFGSEHITRIMVGVKSVLSENGVGLVVQAANMDFDEEADLIERLDRSTIAGAIIYPPPLNKYVGPLRKLFDRDVPYVLVDTVLAGLEKVNSVTVDSVAMGRMAMECLITRGHRKIGIVDIDGDAATMTNIRIGIDEVVQNARTVSPVVKRVVGKADHLDAVKPWVGGYEMAKRLMDESPDVTAILAMHENLAHGVFRYLKESGRRVPRDVSLIGLGDLNGFTMCDPNITVVDQPYEQIGEQAARRLLHMLDNREDKTQSMKLPPKLIERESIQSPST